MYFKTYYPHVLAPSYQTFVCYPSPVTYMILVSFFQAVHKLRDGSITAKDLCEKCIERLNKTQQLNAFITETVDVSRDSAAGTDKRRHKSNYI